MEAKYVYISRKKVFGLAHVKSATLSKSRLLSTMASFDFFFYYRPYVIHLQCFAFNHVLCRIYHQKLDIYIKIAYT